MTREKAKTGGVGSVFSINVDAVNADVAEAKELKTEVAHAEEVKEPKQKKVTKHAKPGRPSKGEAKKLVAFNLPISLIKKMDKDKEIAANKSKFVVDLLEAYFEKKK